MLPERVSNPGPLTYESGALPTALRGSVLNSRWAYRSFAKSGRQKFDLFSIILLTFS